MCITFNWLVIIVGTSLVHVGIETMVMLLLATEMVSKLSLSLARLMAMAPPLSVLVIRLDIPCALLAGSNITLNMSTEVFLFHVR